MAYNSDALTSFTEDDYAKFFDDGGETTPEDSSNEAGYEDSYGMSPDDIGAPIEAEESTGGEVETPKEEPTSEEVPSTEEPTTPAVPDFTGETGEEAPTANNETQSNEHLMNEMSDTNDDIGESMENAAANIETAMNDPLVIENQELTNMLATAMNEVQESQSKLRLANQQIEILTNRQHEYMSDVDAYRMYRPTIEKLEANPDLLTIVRYIDNGVESKKNIYIGALASLLTDATGIDFIEQTKNAKAGSLAPSTKSSIISDNDLEESFGDEEMFNNDGSVKFSEKDYESFN